MTSQVLKFVDSPKTKKSKHLEKETLSLLEIKKIVNGYTYIKWGKIVFSKVNQKLCWHDHLFQYFNIAASHYIRLFFFLKQQKPAFIYFKCQCNSTVKIYFWNHS